VTVPSLPSVPAPSLPSVPIPNLPSVPKNSAENFYIIFVVQNSCKIFMIAFFFVRKFSIPFTIFFLHFECTILENEKQLKLTLILSAKYLKMKNN